MPQTLCEQEGHQALECEHLLLSLMKDPGDISVALIKKLGVDSNELVSQLKTQLGKYPKIQGSGSQIYISQDLKTIVDKAVEESRQVQDEFLSGEHILLAVAKDAKSSWRKNI